MTSDRRPPLAAPVWPPVRGLALALVLLLLLLLAPSAPALADDDHTPEDPREWLIAVIEAAKSKDEAALKRLASQPATDPWRAVDALHARGHWGASERFARSVTAADTKSLQAYAARVRQLAAKARAALREVQAAADAGDGERAVFQAGLVPAGAPAVVRADVQAELGRMWESRGEQGKACRAFAAQEAITTEIGWIQGGLDALAGRFTCEASLGHYEEAQRVLARRAELARRANDQLALLGQDIWLGGLLIETGKPARAAALIRKALPALEKAGEDPYTAEAHATLAQALTLLGQYGLALHHSERSLALYQALDSLNGVLYARSGAIATYSMLRLDDVVSDLCQVQVRESAGLDPSIEAMARLVWATVEARAGHVSKSEHHFERALHLLLAARDDERVALALLSRGHELYAAEGDDERASRDYRQVMSMEAISERFRAYARLFEAECQFERGASEAAMRSLRDVVRQAPSLGDECLEVLALSASSERVLAAGDPQEALDLASQATARVLAAAAGLAESERVGLLGAPGPVRAARARLAAALALGHAATVHDAVEAARAIDLLASLGGNRQLRRTALPDGLRRGLTHAGANLEEAQRAWDTLQSRGGQMRAQHEASKVLKRARRDFETARARFRREASQVADVAMPALATASQVRGWLDSSEAFVSFVVSSGDVHALVLTKAAAMVKRVGPLTSIGSLARALDPVRDPDVARPEKLGELPAQVAPLAAALLGPLKLKSEIRSLIVSPAAELVNLPWPLLGGARGQRRVTLVPSASVLLQIEHTPYAGKASRLAIGVSEYGYGVGDAVLRLHHGGRPLDKLRSTLVEARAVAREGDDLLLGPAATEAAVKAQIRAKRTRSVVHFACHGILNRDRPALSALALLPAPGEDGFLSGAELLALPMDCDLVVLSACDTGTMAPVAGEGFVGIPRALIGAGARRVLANLWKVDDEAGAAFMRLFYESLDRGAAPQDALREARGALVQLNNRWAHPYYWAGWSLWGTPR